MFRFVTLVVTFVTVAAFVITLRESRAAEVIPTTVPATAPVPILSPEDEIATLKLPPGLHVELVASEPMVQHPVAMTFDPDGRLWVVEMRSYMQDTNGTGENDAISRISVLEDTDGDGRMDKRTIFADDLVMPRAIAIVNDGVLVGAPPNLFLMRDTDGDGHADQRTIIASDYGVRGNPEHQANGLLWAMDNWIYSAAYGKRIREINGKWTFDLIEQFGQWGVSQDDTGRLFHNNNSDHLRASFIPPHYPGRNPFYRSEGSDEQVVKDQTCWPSHSTAVNRGYRPKFLREDGSLRAFTAACAPLIYRGAALGGDYEGDAFVCEPSANLIRRVTLFETGNGAVAGRNPYEHDEFLTSTYERFRPVFLSTGPDGALYVVDMHHGLLQHRNFLTTYAKAGYLARNLQAGMMTGRIFRIVRDGAGPTSRPSLSKAPTPQLIDCLSNPNAWWRETAQRLLVERGDYKAAAPLKKLVKSATQPVTKLHALWTLEGIRQLDVPTVTAALSDADPKVRAAAIRLSEVLLASPSRAAILPAVLKLASDHQPDVRLQFALTVSGIGAPEADVATERVLQESGTNLLLHDACISGARGRELWFLQRMLEAPHGSGDEGTINLGVLTALSQPIANEGNPKRVVALLELIAAQPAEREAVQAAMLNGFPDPPRNKSARRPRSIMLTDAPAALAELQQSRSGAVRDKLEKVTALVHWPGQPGYVPPPPPVPLTPEQQARFEQGKKIFSITCAACHKPDGMGQSGLAPPLVGSEWVLGPDTRIARIVLHGLRGPVTLDGRLYNLEMPGIPILKDDDIAAVLTYVRREWDHTAPPVEPATIAKIRKDNAERTGPWTEKELLSVRGPSTGRAFEN